MDLSIEPDQLLKIAEKFNYTVKISDLDIENLQDTIKFLVKIGTLDKEYDFKPYANRKYVESANISQYLG